MPVCGRWSSFVRCALLLAGAGAVCGRAHADTIDSGTYYEFHFGDVTSYSEACSTTCSATTDPEAVLASGPGPYTFTLVGSGSFLVQDLLEGGDRFAVYDNGFLLGATSVTEDGAACGTDIGVCATTAGISQGSFLLAGGDHSITIEAIQSDLGHGSAVFALLGDVETPGQVATNTIAPEPASVALLGTGLLGLVGVARRRGLLAG